MRKLPRRMHFKHSAYYYVHKNKWHPLGKDFSQALRLYAALIEPQKAGGIPDFIERGLQKKQLAENTRKAYSIAAKKLKVAFADFFPSDLRPTHFYQWISAKGISGSMAQTYRSVMVCAMQLAVEEGAIDSNPMREVRQWRGGKRDRYLTDAEYMAIRDNANQTLRAIMAISLLTGQRIGDVLKVRYADLTEDGVYIEQEKTGVKLCVAWTPDLREAIATAKATHTSVKGLTIFSTRAGKPLPYSTVRDWWLKARSLAGVEDGNMHDIRAKTATDADKQGVDSKSLLGHKSESAHLRYKRSKETPLVQPIKMIKS